MATKNGSKAIFVKCHPYTLQIPCGLKILSKSLSRTVSEINALLRFTQKFKMAANTGGKAFFCEKSPVDSAYMLWVKNHSISHHFRDKCAFVFYTEIQDGCQKWWESDICLKSPVDCSYTLWAKNFVEIALSRTVSKISVSTFHAEIQDGCQKWREGDSCEKSPVHSEHPGRSDISTKSLYLARLRRWKPICVFPFLAKI